MCPERAVDLVSVVGGPSLRSFACMNGAGAHCEVRLFLVSLRLGEFSATIKRGRMALDADVSLRRSSPGVRT